MRTERVGLYSKERKEMKTPAQMNRPLGENCAAYNIQGLVAIPISCAIRPFPVPPMLLVLILFSLLDTDNRGFADDKQE